MGKGTVLLDEALDLAAQEKIALEDGAYEKAIELAEQRGKITDMAWNVLDMAETAPYKARLSKLADMQKQLTAIASRAQDVIRASLCRSRQEKRRINGYHIAVGQALQ